MLVELRQLYNLVGRPPLRGLAEHAKRQGHRASRSALSNLLGGNGKPRLDTVEAFVVACASFARVLRPSPQLDHDLLELRLWRERHAAAYPDQLAPITKLDRERQAVPKQLPPRVSYLAGRVAELGQLQALLRNSADGSTSTAIATVWGTAGVGKTTLALWLAHEVADRFPDGQLYVDLRGFSPGSAMRVEDAVRRLLDAFEIPAHRIPAGIEPQKSLYRSILADRRVLVILDNARDAEHVRGLLPGSPTCFAIVTSRNDLAGLVAAEGATPVLLDLLEPVEAKQLLTHLLGADRVSTEPVALQRIIDGCARLPLALAIAATRAAEQPHRPLAGLAEQLEVASGRLDALAVGEAPDVRAVMSWSYEALDADSARLFRLLGLHPGLELSAEAAASLIGATVREVRPILGRLIQAGLIAEHPIGRYNLHDLLRAYAVEMVHGHELPSHRKMALERLFDHYLQTACIADRTLAPHRARITIGPPRSGVTPTDIADYEHALAWFTKEHSVLLATVKSAIDKGLYSLVGHLAWALTTFLYLRGHWGDWAYVQSATLDSAQRLRDQAGQATAHRQLASSYIRLGRLDEALDHLREALDLIAKSGDSAGAAGTHYNLAYALDLSGRHREALRHARHSLHYYRAGGDSVGLAEGLNLVGWCHAKLGQHRQAVKYCQAALLIHQQQGDRHGEAGTWDSLGYAYSGLGQHIDAAVAYKCAVDLYRDLGDRYDEADTLVRAGDNHAAAGKHNAAQDCWRRAVVILDELGHPDVGEVRRRLQGT